MKQIIINAPNQAFAIKIAKKDYGINVQHDGTSFWKKRGRPMEGFPFVNTCLHLLDNYTDRKVNSGIIINLDSKGGKAYCTQNYKVDKCIYNRGRLRPQLKRITEVVDTVTNEVVGEAAHKNDALTIAKHHVIKTGHTTHGVAKFVVKDPEKAIVFKVEMTEVLKSSIKRFLVVVLDQMGDVKAKGAWHANKNR